MKKICIIYYLDILPFTQEQCFIIRDAYGCSGVILLKACNQLDNIQYPYITVEEIEYAETNE